MNTAREFKFVVNFIAVAKYVRQTVVAARNFRNYARNLGGAR